MHQESSNKGKLVDLYIFCGPLHTCIYSTLNEDIVYLLYMLYIHEQSHVHVSSFFLGKVTALGVLCCFALFVCLILLASFFLPSHLSFKNMYIY